jgi:hypothetical protein
MKISVIELKRRFQGSAALSMTSFKRTIAESENWKGTTLPTGWYKLKNHVFLYFDSYAPRTHALLLAIQANGLPGGPINFL